MSRRTISGLVLGGGLIAIASSLVLMSRHGSRYAIGVLFLSDSLGFAAMSFMIRAQIPTRRSWASIFGVCAASLGAAVLGLAIYSIPRLSDPFFLVVGIVGLVACQLLLLVIAARSALQHGTLSRNSNIHDSHR